jgi:cyclase
MMRKITDNVYVEDRYSVQPANRGCNPGFVTTAEGIVLIDTPMIPREAQQWRDAVSKIGEVRYIINTHFHADHTAGDYFFTAPVIGHEGFRAESARLLTGIFIPAVIKRSGGRPLTHEETARYDIEDRDPGSIPLMDNFHLRLPDISFSERLTLYLGQHTFELLNMPGHVASHIGVYIPREKVIFTGDNFTNQVQPVLSNSLPLEWIESLKRIEAMDVELVVPGHGKVGRKADVREFRLFLEKCLDLVKEAIKKGLSKEEAMAGISFEGLYPAVHPGPEQQRLNVARLYDALMKQGK